MHRHRHNGHHHHDHNHAHDHDHPHDHLHNHPHGPKSVAQWQVPHKQGEESPQPIERDLDQVEAVFAEGFAGTSDVTSFLRLAQIPFEIARGDAKLILLRVEAEQVADVGSVTPHVGGKSFRYDPLPARMVSRRQRLRFVYFDGQGVQVLSFAEVRGAYLPSP
jgi:hypothetical protein